MIKITDARIARGYSSYDHLLDDQPLAAIIGREYRTLASAARDAGRALRGTQDRRCGSPQVVCLYDESGNGWRLWTDGSRA